MQPNRRGRLTAVVQDELSATIRGLKDPRIESLTVTRVEVTEDGGMATAYITLLGGNLDAQQEGLDDATREKLEAQYRRRMRDTLEGLRSASGFLRRHLASALTTRTVPELTFKEDKGLENTSRVHALLKKLGGSGNESEGPAGT